MGKVRTTQFLFGEMVLYSMLAKKAHRALISWEPINARIIKAKFKTKHHIIKLSLIQCYAPTNDAEKRTLS